MSQSSSTPHPATAERGQRVRLISHVPAEMIKTDLVPGDEGTVLFSDGLGTVHVRWDSGGTLGLIPGSDEWETITEAGQP